MSLILSLNNNHKWNTAQLLWNEAKIIFLHRISFHSNELFDRRMECHIGSHANKFALAIIERENDKEREREFILRKMTIIIIGKFIKGKTVFFPKNEKVEKKKPSSNPSIQYKTGLINFWRCCHWQPKIILFSINKNLYEIGSGFGIQKIRDARECYL